MYVVFQKQDGYWDRAATRDNTSMYERLLAVTKLAWQSATTSLTKTPQSSGGECRAC